MHACKILAVYIHVYDVLSVRVHVCVRHAIRTTPLFMPAAMYFCEKKLRDLPEEMQKK